MSPYVTLYITFRRYVHTVCVFKKSKMKHLLDWMDWKIPPCHTNCVQLQSARQNGVTLLTTNVCTCEQIIVVGMFLGNRKVFSFFSSFLSHHFYCHLQYRKVSVNLRNFQIACFSHSRFSSLFQVTSHVCFFSKVLSCAIFRSDEIHTFVGFEIIILSFLSSILLRRTTYTELLMKNQQDIHHYLVRCEVLFSN